MPAYVIADVEVREPTLARLYDWLGANRQSNAGEMP